MMYEIASSTKTTTHASGSGHQDQAGNHWREVALLSLGSLARWVCVQGRSVYRACGGDDRAGGHSQLCFEPALDGEALWHSELQKIGSTR